MTQIHFTAESREATINYRVPPENACIMEFTVIPIEEWTCDGKPVIDHTCIWMEGFLKWDGCINYTLDHKSQHHCGLTDAKFLGAVMDKLYSLGDEHIHTWDKELAK